MPRLAPLLAAAFFLVVFVLRAALQWRRTGVTGIKVFSSSMSRWELTAALALVIGLAVAGIAPLSALLGWPGGRLLFSIDPVHWTGAACAAVGIACVFASQLAMGDSWDAFRSAPRSTVRDGLPGRSCAPFYSHAGVHPPYRRPLAGSQQSRSNTHPSHPVRCRTACRAAIHTPSLRRSGLAV